MATPSYWCRPFRAGPTDGFGGHTHLLKVTVGFLLLAVSLTSIGLGSAQVRGQTGAVVTTEASPLSLSLFISGLTQPTHLTNSGDGTGRLFIVERAGRILLAKNGVLKPAPFLDITQRVGSAGGEQGLLSVAFPPEYATRRHFYVDYTDANGNTVISRFTLTANPDVADPSSEQLVLAIPQPFENHNGGQLAFGPNDGYLYIAMGDGGSGGDPGNRAQDPAELLGKILRIDVETGNPATYSVPPSNPFAQTPGFRTEIWAAGLRNPWRFSFDALGNLYIADVGQGSREEIDFQPFSSAGGENYGWRILEGSLCFNPSTGCSPPERYAPPVAEYDHGLGCAVTGGHLVRGIYFYSDICSGRLWGLRRLGSGWENSLLLQAPFGVSTFGLGEDGALYAADYAGGNIYLLRLPLESYLPDILHGIVSPAA